jgi:hypothetical protein
MLAIPETASTVARGWLDAAVLVVAWLDAIAQLPVVADQVAIWLEVVPKEPELARLKLSLTIAENHSRQVPLTLTNAFLVGLHVPETFT